jgi:hypothetical protein
MEMQSLCKFPPKHILLSEHSKQLAGFQKSSPKNNTSKKTLKQRLLKSNLLLKFKFYEHSRIPGKRYT